MGDDLFARYLRAQSAGPAPIRLPRSPNPSALEADALEPENGDFFTRYLRAQTRPTSAPEKPGLGSRILHGVLAPQDVAFRAGARHLFGIPVSDEATAAQALSSGLGLRQGDEGYGGHLAREALEFGTDVFLNPTTYAIPGGAAVARGATAKAALAAGERLAPEALGALAPEAATAAAKLASQGLLSKRISQAAGVGFTGMMGAGLAQNVPRIYEDIQHEGFTPQVAGEVLRTGLEAAGAGLGAAHVIHGFRTPYGVPEPAPRIEVPLEGPVQPGAIPRVTTVESLQDAARVNAPGVREPVAEPGSDATPVPGFDRPIPRGRGLTDDQRAVEDRAIQQVVSDPQAAIAAYRAANTKNGTLIINTDNARELFPDYSSSPENRSLHSPSVHEPSSWLVNRAWEQALAEPVPEGKNPDVVFTSGGTGVGKSTGLHTLGQIGDDAQIHFDTNMNTLESAVRKIEQAKSAGKNVIIQYTHRDPVDAWFNGVIHRALRPDYGRMVPLDAHIETSEGAPVVSRQLRERYADDPSVAFVAVDNSLGKGNSKLVDPTFVDGLQYDWSKVREEIAQETARRHAAGELPDRILKGAGIGAVEPTGAGTEVRTGVGGQPEPTRGEGPAAGPVPAPVPGAAPAAPVPAEGVVPPQPVAAAPPEAPPAPVAPPTAFPTVAPPVERAGGGNAVPESAAAARYAVASRPEAEPRPTSPLGFYSQLERVVSTIPQPMRGSDMARYLSDPKRGVKAEEMKWTGLDDWLKERAGTKVTPQEVQEFVAANKVEVREVELGETLPLDIKKYIGEPATAKIGEHGWEVFDDQGRPHSVQAAATAESALMKAQESGPTNFGLDEIPRPEERKPTKFGSYQTPGGTNYREVLLTLPDRQADPAELLARAKDLAQRGGTSWEAIDDHTQLAYITMARGELVGARFTGGHFDEPNVLAHVRLNDRFQPDPNGPSIKLKAGDVIRDVREPGTVGIVREGGTRGFKILLIEEVQSDWAQKGRREGFVQKPKWVLKEEGGETFNVYATREEAVRDQLVEANAGNPLALVEGREKTAGVPSAPFVTDTSDWSALAMKRIIRMAAEEGYDRVAWTTGEQQSARYDLSKHVDSIQVMKSAHDESGYHVRGVKNGVDVIARGPIPREELPNFVGKDLADKALADLDAEAAKPGGNEYIPKTYSGLDLKVGGEGMNAFYDKILPQVVEKIGKKWGAKVGETRIEAVPTGQPARPVTDGRGQWRLAYEDGSYSTDPITHKIALFPSKAAAEAALPETTTGVHSLDITPAMRASVTAEGLPQFRTGERTGGPQPEPGPSIKTADVQAAFGKAPVRKAMGGWSVTVGGNREVFVHPTGEIEYNPAAFKAGYQREMAPTERVVGEYRRVGRDGVIWLAKDAPAGTVHHEAFHSAMDLVLSDKERAAVLGKYGNEEAAAEAYAKWRPQGGPNSWFSKILQFFQRVYRSFKPTWESAFEETRSGRAFGREEPTRAPVQPPTPTIFTPARPADFLRAKAASSRPGFLSEYDEGGLAGKQVFLSRDRKTGYLVDGDGDFGNLFNNGGPKGAGREAILQAIEKGNATTLDAFDGFLPHLYAQYGFKPTGAMKWADQYAPAGWDYGRDGRPDVVFMSYQGGPRGTIRDRAGTFEPYTHPGNYYDDFAQAKADSRAAGVAGQAEGGQGRGLGAGELAGAGEPASVPRQPVASTLQAARVGQPPGGFPRYATAPAEPPQVAEPPLTERLKKAALGEGGRVSAKPGAGGDREGPLNLDRLNTPDDVKQFFDRATTAALPEINRGKGRMTLAEIKSIAEDIHGKGGFDEKALEKAQRENSALNAAKITVARQMDVGLGNKTMDAARALIKAQTEKGDVTRAEENLEAAIWKWKGVLLNTLGRSAEAGRALSAHNILVEGLTPEQRIIRQIARRNGGTLSDEGIRDIMKAAAAGDLPALKEAIRRELNPTWFDKFFEVYINGLISGPATHIANPAGNTSMQAAGVVKRLLSAGIEQVVAKIQKREPERAVDEVYSHLRGLKRGFAAAFEPDSPYSFTRALRGGVEAGKMDVSRVGAIPGKVGEIVRLPGTLLEAEDKVFKSASFLSEAYVRAGRKARGEAKNRGMSEAASEEYVSKRRDEIVDAIDKAYRTSTKEGKKYSGPFKDIFDPAEQAANYDTFQKQAGPILSAIMGLRERDPTGLFKIFMPFMRTPANIAKVTLEHTPFKVFDVIRKIRKGELKGGEISDELAKPLFGALLAIPVVYMAKEGMLTGSGPTDPRERELWRATGAQPNSVVVPIDGKLTYINYGRLEPLSTLMTMAVDFNEAADAKTRGTAADKIVGTILNAVNDKTFLAGLSDLVLAWHDPKRYASSLVRDTAGNLVPFSTLMRATAHIVDPVVRQRVSVLDGMIANIPGLSKTLPAKPTGTGVPIEREHPILSSYTPFGVTTERPENKIERLMLDLDYYPSKPQRILTIPGSHGRKVELTREEFAAFEKADRQTTERLQGMADRLSRLPPEQQRAYLERVYGEAARRVRERLYSTPSFRERARAALEKARQERTQAAGAP